MFEIIINLCLLSNPEICRQQLLAGLETPSEQRCVAVRDGLDISLHFQAGHEAAIDAATCREMPAGLQLTEVANGIFVHRGEISQPSSANLGDISNSGVVIGEKSIAVIDAGGSRAVGEDLYRAIRKLSPLPVSHLVLTHVHPDHVFGAAVFAEAGAEIVGHPNLFRALREREETYLRTFGTAIGEAGFLGTHADFAVGQVSEIDLGGRKLVLKAWPLAHSSSDLTALDDLTGTLFAGDLIFEGHVPVLDGSLKGWKGILGEFETMAADRVVPGHGGPALPVADGVAPMRSYLLALEDDTRKALDAGERMSSAVTRIALEQAPFWDLFDAYNARNATVAFTELEWE
ncbi:quinoprotein relay system zinc metallohydrolase 2 [Roseibium marinum]|nr:quinoprotein relay system zinc metallohydrolase 2 [Roseibium marinum]